MSAREILLCLVIAVVTFLAWELVAWFTHRYIMHGPLWSWHRSHHEGRNGTFERNDLFAVGFSIPSIALFYYFSRVEFNPYWLSAAFGIFCYGVFYVVFHDVIVHQRVRWKPARQSRYLRRMINAHYIHHSRHTKEGCEAFGFLIAPRKYDPEFREPGSETR